MTNTYYSIQIGVFSTVKSANEQIQKLSDKGIYATRTNEAPYHILYGLFQNESSANAFRSRYLSQGDPAYVKKMVIQWTTKPFAEWVRFAENQIEEQINSTNQSSFSVEQFQSIVLHYQQWMNEQKTNALEQKWGGYIMQSLQTFQNTQKINYLSIAMQGIIQATIDLNILQGFEQSMESASFRQK
jgi:hypothetical protein